MKKSFVALGVAAVLAGAAGGAFAANSIVGSGTATPAVADTTNTATNATALELSESGIGHILFVPYFNAVGGNATLLNLVNTDTTNGKAVKVRFRGATNSDDIFDFTLFLSPGDVWAAKVSRGADGLAVLETSDNSITLPQVVSGQKFVTARLPAGLTAEQKAAETLEGYLEILNVANVPTTVRAGSATAATNPLYTAIKHVNGVAPGFSSTAGAAALNKLKDPVANEAEAVGYGFDAPTGGLFANWTIIDLQNASVAWSGEATAVQAVNGGVSAAGRIVFSPQVDGVVDSDVASKLTADPLLRYSGVASGTPAAFTAVSEPAVAPQYFDFPDLSTPYVNVAGNGLTAAASPVDNLYFSAPIAQAQALSRSLAVTSIKNEFLTDPTISAATDWTFSIPTRRYGVAVQYGTGTTHTRVFNTVASAQTDTPVVGDEAGVAASSFFTAANTSLSTTAGSTHKLVITTGSSAPLTAYDRSENSKSSGFVISPNTAAAVDFPGEVSVLSFNAGGTASASVLGAAITRKDVDVDYNDGWANIATTGIANAGLPIVGHAFTRAVGPEVAGKSTNFGTTARHRFTRPAL